jgi:hypothetical protein
MMETSVVPFPFFREPSMMVSSSKQQKGYKNIYAYSLDGGATWISTDAAKDDTNKINLGISRNRGRTFDSVATLKYSGTSPVPAPSPSPTPTPTPSPTVPILGTVDVVNHSTTDSDDTIKKWVAAVQLQANNDISKYWSYTVQMNVLPKGATPTKGHWMCGFFDNSTDAGVLGWHDVTPDGQPLIKVFTKESEKYGESPSVTLSHEIAESIGDPDANTTIKGYDESGKPCLYFMENCDPVEAREYNVNGVPVSDFVTPAWWVASSTTGATRMDFLGAISKPYEILQGGYMLVSYDNGQNWNEVDKFSKLAARHRSPHSRWELYKTPLENRKRSTFKTK